MRQTNLMTAVLIGAALWLPGSAVAAIQLAGEAFQVQGRMHLSADLSDTDGPEGTNLGLSSNESYLGFSGKYAVNSDWMLDWQVEQELRIDSGEDGWTSRNSFVGFSHQDFGKVLFGLYDSPFRTVGARWGVLTNTVADRRSILGVGSLSGNVLNRRARNAVMYMNQNGPLELQAMYAAQGQSGNDSSVDDNDNDMFSVAAWYKIGALELSGGFERWSSLDTGVAEGRVTGLRFAARHPVGRDAHVGAIFELIDTSGADMAELDRNAVGINGSYRIGQHVLEAQLLFAGDRRGLGSSGAINLGVGVTRKIDERLSVYGAFALTDNDSNAMYPATGGGHGDRVETEQGGTPMVVSGGFVFRF